MTAVARRRAAALTLVAALIAAALIAIRAVDGGNRPETGSHRSGSAFNRPPLRLALRPAVSLAAYRLPAPVSGEVLLASADRLLIAGGLDPAGASAGGVFDINPRSGRIQPAGSLAEPIHDAAGARLGEKTFVFGGGTSSSYDTVELLQPGGQARVFGAMPRPRSDLVAVTSGGSAYLLGGYDGATLQRSVLATEDGRHFTVAGDLAIPVRYPSAAAVRGRLLVFGGETADGIPTSAIQAIDPKGGTSRVEGRLPFALDHSSAVVLGGRVYLLGGGRDGTATRRILCFDPSTGSVSPAGLLPMAIANAAAAVVGGQAYLVGGIGADGRPLATVIRVGLRT